jgi:hypothetical protein
MRGPCPAAERGGKKSHAMMLPFPVITKREVSDCQHVHQEKHLAFLWRWAYFSTISYFIFNSYQLEQEC